MFMPLQNMETFFLKKTGLGLKVIFFNYVRKFFFTTSWNDFTFITYASHALTRMVDGARTASF